MRVLTRSNATRTRSGNVRRSSVGKSAPTKKRSQVKSGIRAARPSAVVAPPRPPRGPSIRQRAGGAAAGILSRIARVKHVGGFIDAGLFGFYDFGPTLTRCMEGHLRRRENNPNMKPWIFLISEGFAKDDGRGVAVEQLPVIVVVESEVAPVDYTCKVSLQGDRRDFSSFRDAGLEWVKNEDAYFLQSFSLRFDPDDVYALLPLKRPSMIDALEPLPVKDVEVEYKGRAVFAQTKNDVIHAIRLEEDLDLSTDLDPLVATVKAAKQAQRERNSDRVRAERDFFSRMVASLTMEHRANVTTVRASLEAMKVYKVYPEYEPETLPPPTEVACWFGGTQRKGDVKNAKLDSLFGDVDGFF